MRPFALEIARIAGWYDGKSIHVHDETSDDDDVRYHEAQHSSIFLNTPDGQLLHVCIRYADIVDSIEVIKRNSYLIIQNINASRIAHECSASFIGVEMGHDVETRKKSYERLPKDYKAYYNAFDSMLEGIARSSFLRCAMAQAITHVVFSSRAFERWIGSNFNYEALIFDPPDQRWHMLQSWWVAEGRKRTSLWITESLGNHPEFKIYKNHTSCQDTCFFDLDNDEIITASPEFARAVDAWIIGGVYDFLINNSPLISLSSASAEFSDLLEKTRSFHHRFGVDLKIYHTDKSVTSYENRDATRINMFRSNLDVVLHQVPHRIRENKHAAKLVEEDNIKEIINNSDKLINFLFHEDGILAGVCTVEICNMNGEIQRHGHRREVMIDFDHLLEIKPEVAVKIIIDYMHRLYFGDVRAMICGIVVPHENPCDGTNYAALKKLLHTHPALPSFANGEYNIEKLTPVAMLGSVYVEYMRGDFYEFVLKHCETHIFGFHSIQVGQQPQVMVFWAEQDLPPRYIMKALPYKFGVPVAHFMIEEASSNTLRLLDTSIPPAIENAIRLICSHWKVI